MSQVKSVLAEVDAKIDEVETKLESNDVEPDTLQVNDLLNFFKVHIKVLPVRHISQGYILRT